MNYEKETMNMTKKILIKYVLVAVLSFLLATGFALGFLLVNFFNADAYTSVTLPSGNSAIGNLYDGTDFNRNNFLKFAKKLGYDSFLDLVDEVEKGTKKNAAQMGEITVALGNYINSKGVDTDLVWMPTYLSTDSAGNAILTLWLADVAVSTNADGATTYTVNDQEASPFTDGTYNASNNNATQSWTGDDSISYTVYMSTYDSSFVRHVMLGLSDDNAFRSNYTQAWGHNALWTGTTWNFPTVDGSRITSLPAANTMNKFRQLTQGALSQYVVTPSQVGWQMAQNKYKNDPGYTGTGAAYYPKNWVGDKIWIPSLTDIEPAYWNLNAKQIAAPANFSDYYIRTPDPTQGEATSHYALYLLNRVGSGSIFPCLNNPVLPAFHLNLSMIAKQFVDVPEIKSATAFTYTGVEQSLDLSDSTLVTGFDANKMYVSNIAKKVASAGTVAPSVDTTEPDATKRTKVK